MTDEELTFMKSAMVSVMPEHTKRQIKN